MHLFHMLEVDKEADFLDCLHPLEFHLQFHL